MSQVAWSDQPSLLKTHSGEKSNKNNQQCMSHLATFDQPSLPKNTQWRKVETEKTTSSA